MDINSDIVELDNRVIVRNSDNYYLILNKPRGYITTMDDEKGRSTVMDLVPERYKNAFVFPVGRLDKDTEGLLLITNDGDLAYYLTHPKFGVAKEYLIELDNPLDEKYKIKIEKGLEKKQLLKTISLWKGVNWSLIISIPIWLILGIILAKIL